MSVFVLEAIWTYIACALVSIASFCLDKHLVVVLSIFVNTYKYKIQSNMFWGMQVWSHDFTIGAMDHKNVWKFERRKDNIWEKKKKKAIWFSHPSSSVVRLPVDEPALALTTSQDHAKDLCASELGPLRI